MLPPGPDLLDACARVCDSLDPRTVVEAAARAAVPLLADACTVEVDGVDAPPARASAAVDGAARGGGWDDDGPAGPELAVPIVARGRTLGRLRLGSPRDAAGTLAEPFARLVAQALDNARRHARLAAAAAARDEQLAVAAHELKTPLTALVLHLQLLRDGARSGPPPLLDGMCAAERQVARLEWLVGHLLDASRPAVGPLEVTRQPVALSQLVTEVLARFPRRSPAHPIGVATPADPCWVAADPSRLEQVLVNLVDNAIKYSPAGGEVRVRVDRDGDAAVRLSVSDAGIGIPAEQAHRVFERFARATNVPARCPGLGLGLFICREIVAAHGGRIWVEPGPDARGSTFVVKLPPTLPAV